MIKQPQFIGSPILGALSDQYGRKRILMLSTGLITFFYVLTALSLNFRILWLLILSRLLTGCLEGNLSIARAMAVDLKDINRHKSLGLINAASSTGYIVGPLIGGILADNKVLPWFNFSVPFYATAFFTFCALVLTFFYLHESLKTSIQTKMNIMHQFNIVGRLKRLGQNRTLKRLLITSTIASLSYDTFYEFFPAYMTGYWHATPLDIAWYNFVLSIAITISCGWLCAALSRFHTNQQSIKYSLPVIVCVLVSMLFLPSKTMVMILFVAIDFSDVFIEKAKARSKGLNIEYRVIDATNSTQLDALNKEFRFDCIVSSMVLHDMSSIDPLVKSLPELLKEHGTFIFSVPHPCFNSGLVELSKLKAAMEKQQLMLPNRYINPESFKISSKPGQPVKQIAFHRPLSALFNVFFNGGFVMTGFSEPVAKSGQLPENFLWAKLSELPPAIICRWKLDNGY